MIEFQVETVDDVQEEITPLLKQHYEEIALYKEHIPFDPDWDRYRALCDAGVLHIVTARDAGRLVGYYISLVLPHLHYQTTLYSHNDVLFVHPDYRGGTLAVRMFKYAEECMVEKGVTVMTIHMKVDLPFDNMVERLGWDYGERMYFKCLKGD